jgi:uncharacterized membrane protein
MSGGVSSEPRERVHALDVIRGVLILGMVFDHIMYDAVNIVGILPYEAFYNPVRMAVQSFGAHLFVMLSGASASISRSNLKRGLMMAAIAAGITLVTWIADHDGYVVFGIIHCLAACAILYALLRPLVDKIPRVVQPVLWLALVLLTTYLTETVMVQVDYLWVFGFQSASFFSADYFPLLPWFFVYLFGTWTGEYIFGGKLPGWFYRMRCRPLSLVGKNSLWVYVLHQPVVLGIMMVVADLMGK